jgi:hypothetical protein
VRHDHFFLPPAFFAATFVDAFLAAFGDLAGAGFDPFAPDFLLPNTLSQFCQNFGVVPVRTIGPLIIASPRENGRLFFVAIVCTRPPQCQARRAEQREQRLKSKTRSSQARMAVGRRAGDRDAGNAAAIFDAFCVSLRSSSLL